MMMTMMMMSFSRSNQMQELFVKSLVFSFNLIAGVGTWERPCVCFVDAGLETLGCQDEVYLVVNLPIMGNCGGGECW